MNDAVRFQAMPDGSQGGYGDPVLFFRTDIDPTVLFEAATSRLESALKLVDALAMMPRDAMVDVSHVAVGLSFLLSDANGMFDALHGLLLELKERREAMAPVTRISGEGGAL